MFVTCKQKLNVAWKTVISIKVIGGRSVGGHFNFLTKVHSFRGDVKTFNFFGVHNPILHSKSFIGSETNVMMKFCSLLVSGNFNRMDWDKKNQNGYI